MIAGSHTHTFPWNEGDVNKRHAEEYVSDCAKHYHLQRDKLEADLRSLHQRLIQYNSYVETHIRQYDRRFKEVVGVDSESFAHGYQALNSLRIPPVVKKCRLPHGLQSPTLSVLTEPINSSQSSTRSEVHVDPDASGSKGTLDPSTAIAGGTTAPEKEVTSPGNPSPLSQDDGAQGQQLQSQDDSGPLQRTESSGARAMTDQVAGISGITSATPHDVLDTLGAKVPPNLDPRSSSDPLLIPPSDVAEDQAQTDEDPLDDIGEEDDDNPFDLSYDPAQDRASSGGVFTGKKRRAANGPSSDIRFRKKRRSTLGDYVNDLLCVERTITVDQYIEGEGIFCVKQWPGYLYVLRCGIAGCSERISYSKPFKGDATYRHFNRHYADGISRCEAYIAVHYAYKIVGWDNVWRKERKRQIHRCLLEDYQREAVTQNSPRQPLSNLPPPQDNALGELVSPIDITAVTPNLAEELTSITNENGCLAISNSLYPQTSDGSSFINCNAGSQLIDQSAEEADSSQFTQSVEGSHRQRTPFPRRFARPEADTEVT
ncbi:hypothetical protein JX266_008423 [Neoarthrinium moseri]|nr:hypothetical protein JX266_008423 [Neoarthrinium moseri]